MTASRSFTMVQRSLFRVPLFAVIGGGWLYLLFLHGLGNRDLWNSHEARAGMDAQAIRAGDWLIPCLNDGRPELQKPPLYYWLVALAASARGGEVDACAVRLPAALSGLLCVAVIAALGRGLGRPREGLLAALLLATAVHFTWLARVGRIDMPLTLTTTVALACFHLALQAVSAGRRFALLACAYLALAAALLLKGPVGVVLVAAALGTFLLWERRVPAPWRLRHWAGLLHEYGVWWGVPLMLGITLPWFLLADAATGGELARVFFWHHNVERGLGGSALRSHPWWFYGPRFLADFAPASLLLLPCLFVRVKDRDARFGLCWLLGMTLVLSLARYKRADYLVPAYPGAAFFLGCVLARWHRERTAAGFTWERRGIFALVLLFVGAALGWWVRVEYVLPCGEARLEHRVFAAVVRSNAPRPQPIYLFQTEAHALAFHLGRPVRPLLHWEELDRLDTVCPAYVVLPAFQASVWRQHLRHVRLEEIARNTPGHEKLYVLYRVRATVPTTTANR